MHRCRGEWGNPERGVILNTLISTGRGKVALSQHYCPNAQCCLTSRARMSFDFSLPAMKESKKKVSDTSSVFFCSLFVMSLCQEAVNQIMCTVSDFKSVYCSYEKNINFASLKYVHKQQRVKIGKNP